MTIHRLLHTRLLTPKKEPFVLKTTTRRLPQYLTDEQPLLFLQMNYSSTRWQENWLLPYSKKRLKTADDKLHKKGNQPTGHQIKGKKVLYIRMLKVLKRIHIHTKTKRILQQLFKPLALVPSCWETYQQRASSPRHIQRIAPPNSQRQPHRQ